MRIMTTSLSTFHGWLPGRILLPAGFAMFIGVGAYVVADDQGYQRGLTQQTQQKEIARLIDEPSEVLLNEAEAARKADRQGIPGLLRAIDPAALYQPTPPSKPVVAAVKPAPVKPAPAKLTPAKHVAEAANTLPTGVERFDRCEGACDTRDPMIVQASYSVTEPLAPRAATPAPAPVVAAESEGFSLPSPGEIVDRTVEGTQSAYGAVRDGAASAIDSVKRAVSGAIDLIR